MVAAINTAIGTNNAIAIRRLLSGNVILTFRDSIPKVALQDQGWVQRAFGETAQLHESEFTVIAKGLPVDRITREDQNQLLSEVRV